MAFLIDRGIAAESEEEFDAEGDRYEELKTKLLDGQTMKYKEMEELLAAAKTKNDQKVIDVLKNVVDDPATDAVTESEKEPTKAEPTKAELLDKLIKMCEPGSGLQIALEEIKDKFALDESIVSDQTSTPLDVLDAAIGKLKGDNDLTADDVWVEDSKEIVLSYENVGWYENLNKWAEDPSDDIESDLAKIYDVLLKSGYGLQYSRKAVEKAIADAAIEAASDPEHITPKENRFGDWDNVATCNVHIPFEIVDGPTNVLLEEDDIEEKEELLPDCVVNEAVETLRRMY